MSTLVLKHQTIVYNDSIPGRIQTNWGTYGFVRKTLRKFQLYLSIMLTDGLLYL
jgi:hypothetical protein